ncbi:MAG: DUF2167 domain-containing protein [Hyphomicrobiaceae bacterium]
MLMRRLAPGGAILGLLAFFALSVPAMAQEKPTPAPNSQEAQEIEGEKALEAALKARTVGPAEVPLLTQAILKLPAGYAFIPKAEGNRLMRAMGNRTGSNFLGLVTQTESLDWFATLVYNDAGYVRDDDAKDWKADDLLQSLKDGTAEGNKDRAARGFPPIEITGWVEPPKYSADTHRLVWAAHVRRVGETKGGSVNYNTYALGREGYFELNMIGSQEVIVREKDRAQDILVALNYVPGKAYGDFQAGTDKVAEYGLAALVAGVAAKKLGMFAVLAAFVAKFAKLILLAAFGAIAVIGRLFKGKAAPPPTE